MESAEESIISEKKENQEKSFKNNLSTNKIESYDKKKLRVVKILLDKFDKGKYKEENDRANSEEENSENIVNKKIN